MNKYTRRQLGIKKALRVIRANPLWKSQFHRLISTRVPCSCYLCKPHKANGAKNKVKKKYILNWNKEEYICDGGTGGA